MSYIMKTNFLLFVILFTSLSYAQMRVVALHSPTNGVQYFAESQTNFQPFLLAYAAAIDGDTIYVGGGNFDVPATFDKRLTVYGTGHYPSATSATGFTKFNAGFILGDASDNSHFEGMYINGTITFADAPTDNITIKRCHIYGEISAPNTTTNYGINCVFVENVFRSTLELSHLRSAQFYNNMIFGTLSNATNHIFVNNNFMAYGVGSYNDGWNINYANACVFENNIFCRNTAAVCSNGTNVWNNNIFYVEPSLGLNPVVQNSILMNPTSVFINYTANTNFDYAQDYHLTPEALTHLGTDGTQRGVYGTVTTYFKEESIPINPHISSAVISPQSTAGQINVNMQVQAQSR